MAGVCAGIEAIRELVCAGKNTAKTYSDLMEYVPEQEPLSQRRSLASWLQTHVRVTFHIGDLQLSVDPRLSCGES